MKFFQFILLITALIDRSPIIFNDHRKEREREREIEMDTEGVDLEGEGTNR